MSQKSHLDIVDKPSVQEVKEYYEHETAAYLDSYGDIVQAARPASGSDFLDYLMDSMSISSGMKLLDAGCGVCGPAIHFAARKNIEIEAITISKTQVLISIEQIRNQGLGDKITVVQGDFHDLADYYPEDSFDIAYFLETLGYSASLSRVIESAHAVLKPLGSIYIKDFFPVPLVEEDQLERQLEVTKAIRIEYRYRLLDLVNLISTLRNFGFFLCFVRRLDFVEDFTNASQFEQRNGYKSYTSAITNPYQLYEPLELLFQKLN